MTSLPRLPGSSSRRRDLRQRLAPVLLALAVASSAPGAAQALDSGSPSNVTIGKSSFDGVSNVFGDIELVFPGGVDIRVAKLTMKGFKRDGSAFQADEALIEGVTIKLGDVAPGVVEIPRASLHSFAGTLPGKDTQSSAGSLGTLPRIAELLLAMKAGHIEIPELKFTAGERVAAYSDIVLDNLDTGRLASATFGKMVASDRKSEVSLGKGSLTGVDFTPYADWFDDARAARAAPGLKKLYDSFELDELRFSEPDGASNIRKITITGLMLAPPSAKPSELAAIVEQMKTGSDYADKHPAEMVRLARAILPAFALGSLDVEGIDLKQKDKRPVSAGLLRIEAVTGNGIGEIRIGDLAGISKEDDSPFKLGSVSLRGLSLGNLDGFFDALAAGTPPEAVDIASYPQVRAASFALSNFDGATKTDGPIHIEGFTLDAPQWTGLWPSQLTMHLKGLSGSTKSLEDEKGRETFEKLGIETVVINADANLNWTEADQTLRFGPTTAEIERFARVSVDGTIGNVPKSVFVNPARSYLELLAVNLHALSVGLEERGSIRRILDMAAKENGTDVQQLPKGLAALASARLSGLIGAVNAEKIAAALQIFLSDPNRIQIDVTTTRPIALAPLVIGGADQLLNQVKENVTVDAKAD